MTIKQVGIRLQPEGSAEVVRAFKSVETAGTQAEQAIAAAASRRVQALRDADDLTRLNLQREHDARQRVMAMSDAQMDRQLANAERARQAMARATSQDDINRVLGVGGSGAGSARASAEAFEDQFRAMEQSQAAAARLRGQLDPLHAAQMRLNGELAEYRMLAQRGVITTREWAAAEAMARRNFDATTAALNRRNSMMAGGGMSRLERASRLNLVRQGADVFTTAAMGMSPGMIAIQQGPQILDAMATSGLKANAAMIAAGAGVAVLGGAVVALGAAWLDAEDRMNAADRATTGLGRTAQMTGRDLRDLAHGAADSAGISAREAENLANAYVSTGRIGGEMIRELIENHRDLASFLGVEGEEAQQAMARAMIAPGDAARDMTRQFGLLDQKTLELIEKFEKQGNYLAANRILLDALTEAAAGHASQVSDMALMWDGVTASIGNAFTNLGLYLERFNLWASIAQRRIVIDAPDSGEVDAALAEQQAEAAANQRAQLAEDRAAAARRGRRGGGRSAAEREAREALMRGRRREDDQARLDMQIAQAMQDTDRLRALREEDELRQRIRRLMDDGLTATQAQMQAQNEISLLDAARAEERARESIELGRQTDLQVARILGEDRIVAAIEGRVELEALIAKYAETEADRTTAIAMAKRDLLQLDLARKDAMERIAAQAEQDHRLTLARLAGDRERTRELETQARIYTAARQFERDRRLDFGEGDNAGRKIVMAELEAEAEGALRNGVRSMIEEVRSGGLEGALTSVFDRATDRLGDRLADILTRWLTQMDGGKGGKGGGSTGNWLMTAANWLFGKNAAGTDYWTGGWTWVGERGPELINAPRGTKIVEHDRSMRMAAQAGGGGAPALNLNMPIHISADGADPAALARLTAEVRQLRSSLPATIVETVAEARQRRVPGMVG